MQALIIVDLQNDFLPKGALAVEKGNTVIKPITEKAAEMPLTIKTRDWHPEKHCSFKENGGIWPKHCVQNTQGAALHKQIQKIEGPIVNKADNKNEDAYSGFQKTELETLLKNNNVTEIWVAGLATEYCVKATVMDGLKKGFKVHLLTKGIAAVNEQDGLLAIKEMQDAGAIIEN